MTDKTNYSLKDLLNELKEKEKGCGRKIHFLAKENKQLFCGKDERYCWFCKEIISALKKGISACEEILNSQQNKMTSNQGMVSNPNLTEVNRTTGSADTEQEKAEGVVYPKGDSDTSPVQTLIKQALSQRNKEILEIIEKITSWTCKCGCITFDDKKCRMCGSDPAYGEIDYKELKQKLTTEGEEKDV